MKSPKQKFVNANDFSSKNSEALEPFSRFSTNSMQVVEQKHF